MTFQFRERSGTGTIHIFDTDDQIEGYPLIPICGRKMGGLTFPLNPIDDVEKKRNLSGVFEMLIKAVI